MITETATYALGCFWGPEFHFSQVEGVVSCRVGYAGGYKEQPTYGEVCSGTTGHAEAIEIQYDPLRVDYRTLTKLFFEIHDPTQSGGQGPDIGDQYRSILFYHNEEQKRIAADLSNQLKSKGVPVVTELEPAGIFWEAEPYHQGYYRKKGGLPYCHTYTKRF